MNYDLDLSTLSEEELIDLHQRIAQRLTHIRQTRRYQELAKFSVGDTVSFTPECGHIVVGTVIRLNQKTATVAAKDGISWRVSPSLLSKVAEGEAFDNKQGVLVSLIDHVKNRRG